MGPVAVALLAALLPTCIIISILLLFCKLLYQKLHQLQSLPKDEHSMTEEGKFSSKKQKSEAEEQPGELQEEQLKLAKEQTSGSNIENTKYTLAEQFRRAYCPFGPWIGSHIKFAEVEEDENRIREIFKRLHYNGLSPAAFCRYIRDPVLQDSVLENVLVWVCYNICSISLNALETGRQPGGHRFSTDTLRALKSYRDSTRGLSMSTTASRALATIPAIIVQEQDEAIERKFNEDVVKNIFEPIEELLWPFANLERLIPPNYGPTPYETNPLFRHFMFKRPPLERAITKLVQLNIKLWASPHQFEVRWPEGSDEAFAVGPDLYIHAREDGTLLDEPQCVIRAASFSIAEDGSIIETTETGLKYAISTMPESGRDRDIVEIVKVAT